MFGVMTKQKQKTLAIWSIALIAILSFLVLHHLWQGELYTDNSIRNAFVGGMIAAGATALGTLPVLFSRNLSQSLTDSMLGFGAGVMLAASFFSLILPGMEALTESGQGPWQVGIVMGISILLGAGLLMLMECVIPHEHFLTGKHANLNLEEQRRLKRAWLFVFAIILHNIPEGLAIGVAFGGVDNMAGIAMSTGIAIQDIPEGLVIALALLSAGYKRSTCVWIGVFSGIVEPIAAVISASFIYLFPSILPWSLGFAAGAMLFVISHEVIPESHRKGHERFATTGLMLGFVLMMILDIAL